MTTTNPLPRSYRPLYWLKSLAPGILALLFTGAHAKAEGDLYALWRFTPDENWQAEWTDKVTPCPFTVSPGDKGLVVGFTEGGTGTSCPLRGLRWRTIEPLGIQPTRLSIDAAVQSGTGISLAPQVLDAKGNCYQLISRPVTGKTLTWDLSADLIGRILKSGTEPVGSGAVLEGPVSLDEIRVDKTAGPAASVVFTGGRVVDPQHSAMVMGEDPLFKFTEEECWVDVNAFDQSIYKITVQPDGLAVTYGPAKKRTAFKLLGNNQIMAEGAIGRAARIITDVELVKGDATSAELSLGLKDSEHEVLEGRPTKLAPGHNRAIWDSTDVKSPWRGAHNGMVDFPLSLDDYTLVMNPTATETKVVFHSASEEVLHKTVYQSGYDASRPRFVWNPGEPINFAIHLVNLGSAKYSRAFHVAFTDDEEHPIWERTGQVLIPARGNVDVPIHIDTTGMAQGVYILHWNSTEPGDAIKDQANLAIADTTPLPKAKPGEFLYGVDMGGLYQQTNLLDWADWCGVDVIRTAGRNENFRDGASERDLADIQGALDALGKHNLKANIMFKPGTPWDPDPAKFDKIVTDQANLAGAVAAKFKGRFLWYEYGNEPSLQPFFFHGSPADYARLFVAVHDAIKAADPSAIVTNGGWAFAGAAGAEQRTREMAKLIPADKIEAWAYHGHGEGAIAERYWYGLARSAANYPDKINKPYYETESGLASTEPVTWRLQARTLVQKFAFAQSTHVIPCFLWFGFHPKWQWGILENFSEIKPAALCYRVLVQRTRGLRAQDRLDIGGAPGEGYWFTGGDGRTTLILWSDTGEYTRKIILGAGSTGVRQYDMFGNSTALTLDSDGGVQVQVGLDPIYISATRQSAAATPKVLPPGLDLPAVIRVVPGAPATLTATVHNQSSSPLQGSVTVTPSGAAPIAPATAPVEVGARAQKAVGVPLTVADLPVPWWPRAWTVFAPVADHVDLSTFTTIPDSISSAGKAVSPQVGIPIHSELDLAALGGGVREKRQAICFAQVTLDAPADIEFGTSADFWMEWFVNGKSVFSTIDSGNGGPVDILGHTVHVHLNKGLNLFVVRVLSGSGGWKLASGGPDALAAARRALSGISDVAIVELRNGAHLLDHETVRVEPLLPLASGDENTRWSTQPPDARLGTVENLFKAAPDETHWYHGPADLSGRFWFRARSDGALVIEAAITDDIDKPGDGIHIHLASGPAWSRRLEISSGQPQVRRHRDDGTSITWYQAIIPSRDLGLGSRRALAINVAVDDDDWGVLKQHASIEHGENPDTWYQTWFGDAHTSP